MVKKRQERIVLDEGLALIPTPRGLVVKAVDYHARPALLNWELLTELAEKHHKSPERLKGRDPTAPTSPERDVPPKSPAAKPAGEGNHEG